VVALEHIRIRQMNLLDVEKVVELWLDSFPFVQFMDKVTEAEKIQLAPVSYPKGCWVATNGKAILGFVITTKYDADIMCLHAIAVRREHRRQGIGTLLLKKVFAVARANGFEAIFLTTRKSNFAKNLYLKQDYEVIAETDQDLLLLKKVQKITRSEYTVLQDIRMEQKVSHR